MMQNWLRKRRMTNDLIERTHGQNNRKTSNPEELHPFEYASIERRTQCISDSTKDNGTTENIQ